MVVRSVDQSFASPCPSLSSIEPSNIPSQGYESVNVVVLDITCSAAYLVDKPGMISQPRINKPKSSFCACVCVSVLPAHSLSDFSRTPVFVCKELVTPHSRL